MTQNVSIGRAGAHLVLGQGLGRVGVPDGMGQRQSRLKPKYHRDGYFEAFDADTLWYDAIWRRGVVSLICPKLNNLRAVVRAGAFDLDGQAVRTRRIRRYYRHDVIELAAPKCPKDVGLTVAGTRIAGPVHPEDTAPFAGLNTALALSKNNDLRWIADFARYHIAHHGLQAMILMDNGSDAYDLTAIETALADTGLQRVMVVSVPWRYGPRGRAPFARTEKFLQTALFNVARLRWLGAARAVLSCDIDELMHTPGTTVFDLAVQSRLGYVRLPGTWRYPDPACDDPTLHINHTHRRDDGKTCPTKWCIVPGGPLGGFQWDVHQLERLPLPSLFKTGRGGFWHCHSVTTGWKQGRVKRAEQGLIYDAETTAALKNAFDTQT